jgi:hypothetical protein
VAVASYHSGRGRGFQSVKRQRQDRYQNIEKAARYHLQKQKSGRLAGSRALTDFLEQIVREKFRID